MRTVTYTYYYDCNGERLAGPDFIVGETSDTPDDSGERDPICIVPYPAVGSIEKQQAPASNAAAKIQHYHYDAGSFEDIDLAAVLDRCRCGGRHAENGRWLSHDPIGFLDGGDSNLYRYVADAPPQGDVAPLIPPDDEIP